ncbi:MAG: hypothetical protein KGZ61_07120, partial [Sandarakinorhabdus sp.]|nr:hypothetical protein [Sandarakinorhabdus sp.]
INLYTPLFIFSKSRLYIRGSGLRRGYRPGEIKCKQIVATPLWEQKFIPTDTDPQGKKSVTVFPSDVSLLSSGKYYSMMKALGWFRKETL